MGCGCLSLILGMPILAAIMFALNGHWDWVFISIVLMFLGWGSDDEES